MDKTTKVFDSWAKAGRAEEMEEGHGVTVGKFLIAFPLPSHFHSWILDVAMAGLSGKLHNFQNAKRLLG